MDSPLSSRKLKNREDDNIGHDTLFYEWGREEFF